MAIFWGLKTEKNFQVKTPIWETRSRLITHSSDWKHFPNPNGFESVKKINNPSLKKLPK